MKLAPLNTTDKLVSGRLTGEIYLGGLLGNVSGSDIRLGSAAGAGSHISLSLVKLALNAGLGTDDEDDIQGSIYAGGLAGRLQSSGGISITDTFLRLTSSNPSQLDIRSPATMTGSIYASAYIGQMLQNGGGGSLSINAAVILIAQL